MSQHAYWAAGATAQIEKTLAECRSQAEAAEATAVDRRSDLDSQLFAFYAMITRSLKERRGFEDECVKIEVKLDNLTEQLSLLEEEDQRRRFREDRKEILRRTERLIGREADERERWEKVVAFLKDSFDLSPEVLLAASNGSPHGGVTTPANNGARQKRVMAEGETSSQQSSQRGSEHSTSSQTRVHKGRANRASRRTTTLVRTSTRQRSFPQSKSLGESTSRFFAENFSSAGASGSTSSNADRRSGPGAGASSADRREYERRLREQGLREQATSMRDPGATREDHFARPGSSSRNPRGAPVVDNSPMNRVKSSASGRHGTEGTPGFVRPEPHYRPQDAKQGARREAPSYLGSSNNPFQETDGSNYPGSSSRPASSSSGSERSGRYASGYRY
ncbi:unnamed protein product [Amoebophrya sp. A25]|nr:unnamed protein product [Amoebophrya sp. A25]|eukprot:GSA25T00008086001.1